jgi:hypothetical protein
MQKGQKKVGKMDNSGDICAFRKREKVIFGGWRMGYVSGTRHKDPDTMLAYCGLHDNVTHI